MNPVLQTSNETQGGNCSFINGVILNSQSNPVLVHVSTGDCLGTTDLGSHLFCLCHPRFNKPLKTLPDYGGCWAPVQTGHFLLFRDGEAGWDSPEGDGQIRGLRESPHQLVGAGGRSLLGWLIPKTKQLRAAEKSL